MDTAKITDEDRSRMKAVIRFSAALYALCCAVSLAFGSFAVTFSVAFGGAVALGNLAHLEKLLGKVTGLGASPNAVTAAAMISFLFRITLLGAALVVFIKSGWINFPGLIAGLSVTVVAAPVWFLALGRGRTAELGHERSA